jgi:hypothetical protein
MLTYLWNFCKCALLKITALVWNAFKLVQGEQQQQMNNPAKGEQQQQVQRFAHMITTQAFMCNNLQIFQQSQYGQRSMDGCVRLHKTRRVGQHSQLNQSAHSPNLLAPFAWEQSDGT